MTLSQHAHSPMLLAVRRRFDRLRAAGGSSNPEREELKAAGVAAHTINSLYPFEFDEVADVLSGVIRIHGLRHLRHEMDDSHNFYGYINAVLTNPGELGLSPEMAAMIRQVFNNREAEATVAQHRLFTTIQRMLRGPNRSFRVVRMMHVLWLSCWLMGHRSELGSARRDPESYFDEVFTSFFPKFDEALDTYLARREQPRHTSPFWRLLLQLRAKR